MVIIAIEHGQSSRFSKLWLKCDSSLLCQIFSSPMVVPWSLKGRWRRCIQFCDKIEFKVSHIFREDKHCANKLTNPEVHNRLIFLWNFVMPSYISLIFFS